MSKLLIALVLFGITGCSNRALYDKLYLDECVKDPLTTYLDCIERTSAAYEEYERERTKILKSQVGERDNKDSDSSR